MSLLRHVAPILIPPIVETELLSLLPNWRIDHPEQGIGRGDPELLSAIRDHREVMSFRNILAHGYDAIDFVLLLPS